MDNKNPDNKNREEQSSRTIINKEEFQRIRDEYDEKDKIREEIIKRSREILKLSKQAIYDLHRGKKEEAEEKLKSAERIADELRAETKRTESDKEREPGEYTGSFKNAMEEYAEAKIFYDYETRRRIPTAKEIRVTNEEYLGGLADFTGELSRKAVVEATNKELDKVREDKRIIEEIYGEFVKFNFRNGELRKKYDSIKYNLQRVENILYDLSLKE